MRRQGRITEWHDAQGYGFITPNGSADRIFLHVTALRSRARRPQENDLVTYIMARDGNGRLRAEQVDHAALRRRRSPRSGFNPLLLGLTVLFLIVIGALAVAGKIPRFIALAYFALSVTTCWVYARDKSAAQSGRWRTPENTLHLLALIGGWPGALFAQQLLRHKSSKPSFQWLFWTIVSINIAALLWLLSPRGARAVAALIGA